MEEQAIDVAELAGMLSISEWKARELGKDLLFPSFRDGNQHRFWPSRSKLGRSSHAILRSSRPVP